LIIIVWFCMAASELLLAVFLYERCAVSLLDGLALQVLNGWLLWAAYTDLKDRRITNHWIVCGLCVGVTYLIVKLALFESGWPETLDCVWGACLGSGILLGGSMIRKGGIGMGDVKLFFVLGLFCGTENVVVLLMLTLVFALIVGVARMILGKMGGKDRLPLGPFAYLAMIFVILGRIPG